MELDFEGIKERHHLGEKELLEYLDAFKLFDKDGNGSIEHKELRSVMCALGMNPTNHEVDNMIREVDSGDCDGRIQFEEFVVFMKNRDKSREAEEAELKEAFLVFDKDGNGTIDKGELILVLTELGEKLTSEEVDDMIKDADENGDGKISYDEFVKLFTKDWKDLA